MRLPPVPIILWSGFHALKALWALVYAVGDMPFHPLTNADVVMLMATAVLSAAAIVGLWRMNRLGVLLLIGLLVLTVAMKPMAVWWMQYPATGPWIAVAWIAAFAATMAVYWKQMSWNVFGPSDAAGEGKRYA